MELLRAENIAKAFKHPVLKGVSFSVSAGECVGIAGRNGCGKSTLLSIIAGGLKADGGSLFIRSENAFLNRKLFAQNVGYAPQADPLMEELSVKDNLALWYGAAGRSLKEALEPGGIAARLGLTPILSKKAAHLSGGMKRRLNLAGAMAGGGSILVLDEPSGGLDVVARAEIEFHLKDYLARGGAMVIATHDRAEMDLCTSLFLLDGGTLHPLDGDISLKELAWKIVMEGKNGGR